MGMVREISAGAVVLHRINGIWVIAVIEPRKEEEGVEKPNNPPGSSRRKPKSKKPSLALPKGLVDPGEKAEDTALREVLEETGIVASPIAKLSDIKYVYVRTWGDGERVFKIVSFYLFRYISGQIDDINPGMRIEVRRASWIHLDQADKLLAYS